MCYLDLKPRIQSLNLEYCEILDAMIKYSIVLCGLFHNFNSKLILYEKRAVDNIYISRYQEFDS